MGDVGSLSLGQRGVAVDKDDLRHTAAQGEGIGRRASHLSATDNSDLHAEPPVLF